MARSSAPERASASATSIDTDVGDSTQVATSLDALATQLESLQADLSRSPAAPPAWTWIVLDVVTIGLLGWLAVIAVVALRIGWRWSRRG